MPRAPRDTWRKAISGHLCALPCGLSATPCVSASACMLRRLSSKASRSRISAGVSTSSRRSPSLASFGKGRTPAVSPTKTLAMVSSAMGPPSYSNLPRCAKQRKVRNGGRLPSRLPVPLLTRSRNPEGAMYDILVYLFENYYTPQACPKADVLAHKLAAVGFEQEDIHEALGWLHGLAQSTERFAPIEHASGASLRAYSDEEYHTLGSEAIGFITFLENSGVLRPALREILIERAQATDESPVSLDRMRIIALMVLWSQETEVDHLLLEELLNGERSTLSHKAAHHAPWPRMNARAPSYRGRFAPSPSGPLHDGSLLAAMASYLDARAHHGQWLLRIEDIDTPRVVQGADTVIQQQLQALGMHWDEAPVWQSQRLSLYEAAFARLQQAGLIYGCACTRRMLTGGPYPGTCRH